MQTIHLVGKKSTVSFDLETAHLEKAPTADFIEYQERLYSTDDPARLIWQLCESNELPQRATVFWLDRPPNAEPVEAAEVKPAEPPSPASALEGAIAELHTSETTIESAPAAEQPPAPPEPAANAEPDHAKTV